MFSRLVILLILCATVLNITIPLTPLVQRCMIAYTPDKSMSLKLDVMFPVIKDQNPSEVYQISIYNTQTKQTKYQTVNNGRFKKQYDLDQNAIYRFCFKAMVNNRQIGTLLMEYSAQTQYNYQVDNMKIPTSLLKDDDLKETYELISRMEDEIRRYQQSTQRKKNTQMQEYTNFLDKNNKVIIITYFEIAVITLAGVYQFFAIRKFLVDKQYM